MKKYYADTSYYPAMLNAGDRLNSMAVALTEDHHFDEAGFVVLMK